MKTTRQPLCGPYFNSELTLMSKFYPDSDDEIHVVRRTILPITPERSTDSDEIHYNVDDDNYN